jgi:hypothetical protein
MENCKLHLVNHLKMMVNKNMEKIKSRVDTALKKLQPRRINVNKMMMGKLIQKRGFKNKQFSQRDSPQSIL